MDSRQYRRKLQYLIKWKGYSDAHNSWEPKENVNAPELLASYHEQNLIAIRASKLNPKKDIRRTLSLESAECTQNQGTLPLSNKHPHMLIRSIETSKANSRMSSGRTPTSPPLSGASLAGARETRPRFTLSAEVREIIRVAAAQNTARHISDRPDWRQLGRVPIDAPRQIAGSVSGRSDRKSVV